MQIEFFGVPRERTGISHLEMHATTLGQLLERLVSDVPSFADFMAGNGLHPSVAANLNGDRFVSDPSTPLAADDHLLILSADVGG